VPSNGQQRRAAAVVLRPVALHEGQLRHERVGAVGVEREQRGGGERGPALTLHVGEAAVLVRDERTLLPAAAHRILSLVVPVEEIERRRNGKERQQEGADQLKLFSWRHCSRKLVSHTASDF
jgi:hypothetical protein